MMKLIENESIFEHCIHKVLVHQSFVLEEGRKCQVSPRKSLLLIFIELRAKSEADEKEKARLKAIEEEKKAEEEKARLVEEARKGAEEEAKQKAELGAKQAEEERLKVEEQKR